MLVHILQWCHTVFRLLNTSCGEDICHGCTKPFAGLQAHMLTWDDTYNSSSAASGSLKISSAFPWLQDKVCLILKVIQLGMNQLGVWDVCNNLSQVLLRTMCILSYSPAAMCLTHPCALQLHHIACGNQTNVISAWSTKNTLRWY